MELDGRDDRKTSFHNGAYDQPACERISSKEIRIRGIDLARQILRGDGLRQAGFMADLANRFTRSSRAPVLFQEGEAHRKQRSATARFFAPKVVATRYRQLMAEQSARIMQDFRSIGRADLDSMGMELSVAVTAEIVGLNDSCLPGLANRLNSFLADQQQRVGKLAASLRMVVALCRILRLFFCDVMPAIRSHRIQRREDIISLLIEQGYSTREILTECITYGVAGVATTRELIVLAAWHLFDRWLANPLLGKFFWRDPGHCYKARADGWHGIRGVPLSGTFRLIAGRNRQRHRSSIGPCALVGAGCAGSLGPMVLAT
jgi:cytochrome P450